MVNVSTPYDPNIPVETAESLDRNLCSAKNHRGSGRRATLCS